jgi:hypothetical protein
LLSLAFGHFPEKPPAEFAQSENHAFSFYLVHQLPQYAEWKVFSEKIAWNCLTDQKKKIGRSPRKNLGEFLPPY